MRARLKVSYAVACASATVFGVGGLASCVGDDSAAPPAPDASIPDYDTGTVPPFDAGTDSAIADAGTDVVQVDAADSAPPFDAGCSPVATLLGFTVPAYVPAAQHEFDCDDPAIDQRFAAACVGDASTFTTCTKFPSTDEDGGLSSECQSCLITPEAITDAGYGPIVLSNGVPTRNVAGCIELSDPTDAGYSCAVALQAAWACAEYACKSSCPVSDDTSAAAYVTCEKTAATTVCNSYTQTASACVATEMAIDAGFPTEVQRWCITAPDPVTQLTDIADYFCRS